MAEYSRTELMSRDTSEIARARRIVRSAVGDRGVPTERWDLELMVSELVSNALLHGRGVIELRVSVADEQVRLAVVDEGGGHAPPAVRADRAVGGWGLRLVDRLADSWGARTTAEGTSVWMSKNLDPGPRPAG